MNEEIDESEFYHQDFTTASEWEVFMARMEEIINQWKSDDMKNERITSLNIWDIRSEKITFADTEFYLHFYKMAVEDQDNLGTSEETDKQTDVPIDTRHDFELYNDNSYNEHSCLSIWYGLKEYIVLTPANDVSIITENKIKILLSSATIVSGNTSCKIPIFVQIREKWQNCYLGVFENESFRINFEMVHLRKGPQSCSHLSELVNIFQSKIMSPCNIEDILTSTQMTYILNDFGNFIWKQELLDGDFDIEGLFILPFGVSVDPIDSIFLKATWSHIPWTSRDSKNNTYFSGLTNTMTAHKWSCSAKITYEPVCLLGDALSEFIQHLSNNSSVHDILGDFASSPPADSNPLDVLTEPAVPAITVLLSRAARQSLSKNRRTNPPINESILVPILYFLFPDADENSTYPYDGREDKDSLESNNCINSEDDFKGFKTAPTDSLCWRLSIVLAHALQSLGGVKAFCHVWYEFVQEMRYRWEKSMPIPGLAPGVPDLRTCLLNQKLQMLNCCIERKLSRENSRSTYDSAEGSDTDDEFYDCSDKLEEEIKRKENQSFGRLSKFGDLKLLKNGEPLYIPVTQEPVLKTEDQLEEDTDVLLKLGSDAEASELRARIMSASLLSDMESFKAANPGSVVEDFIRWYSPRDWIEEEELDEWGQKKGHLSPRMLIEENNIWVQMWETSKPVPASRQKRLFDDTKEGEKVLQSLDFRTVAQIFDLVIPVLAHVAICRLIEESRLVSAELSEANYRMNSLLAHGERISRDPNYQSRRFESFVQEVTSLELLISQINSLRYKFNPSGTEDAAVSEVVANLVAGKEVEIAGKGDSRVGKRIISMFADVQKASAPEEQEGETVADKQEESVLPEPFGKEFVLRMNALNPAVHSALCPQFLRAIINNNEFRLAGAFTEDIVFF